jgi:hypothetical protein
LDHLAQGSFVERGGQAPLYPAISADAHPAQGSRTR